MQLKKIILLLTIALLTFHLSCEKDPVVTESDFFSGENYFPLVIGNYIVYEVTEITIDAPSNYYDTVIYLLKEVITEVFIDNQGDFAHRIERFTKKPDEDTWKIHNVWSAKLVNNMAQKVEENQRFVKIRFPARLNLNWNGNIFNDLDEKRYEITQINTPKSINSFDFDSCLTVTHVFSESLISKQSEYEVFAYNIGLIYKEKIRINSQEIVFDIPIEERITTGQKYTQTIIDYNLQ